MIGEMFKLLFTVLLAHILMPFISVVLQVFLIEYWLIHLFDLSLLTVATEEAMTGHSVAFGFWVVFLLVNFVLAIQWWTVSDI